MIKRLLFIVPVALFMIGCDNAEKETLRKQVDSLNIELERSHQMSQTLTEVGSLMDSIDASRQLLRIDMKEGTTYADYTARMKDLNAYIKATQAKIQGLEKNLSSSKANSAGF